MTQKWKRGEYCDRCQNTGEVDCHCGGDLCVCGAGEIPCPRCHGQSIHDGCALWDDEDESEPDPQDQP